MKLTKYYAHVAVKLISALPLEYLFELFEHEIKQIISQAVVARDLDCVIGVNNDLPWNLPNDLHNFKKLTLHKIIVMGRKTFESLPRNSQNLPIPLKNRLNVIVSQTPLWNQNKIQIDPTSDFEHSFANYLVGLHLEHQDVFLVNSYLQAQVLQLLWSSFVNNIDSFDECLSRAFREIKCEQNYDISQLYESLIKLFTHLIGTKIESESFILIGGQQLFELALNNKDKSLYPIKELIVTEIQHHFVKDNRYVDVCTFTFDRQSYILTSSNEFYGDSQQTIKCLLNKYTLKASD